MSPLRLESRTPPKKVENPEQAELASVSSGLSAVARVRRNSLPWQLLLKQVAWGEYIGDQHMPGALPVAVALTVLTRESQRRWARARRARRQALKQWLSSGRVSGR